MTEYADPPLWKSAPADGQVPVYEAATDRLVPTAIASIGSTLSVPQAADAPVSAPTAETAVAVVAANAATQSGSYVQADVQTIATLANALKVQLNAGVTDIGTLVTELGALTTAVNDLQEALQDAGIIS